MRRHKYIQQLQLLLAATGVALGIAGCRDAGAPGGDPSGEGLTTHARVTIALGGMTTPTRAFTGQDPMTDPSHARHETLVSDALLFGRTTGVTLLTRKAGETSYAVYTSETFPTKPRTEEMTVLLNGTEFFSLYRTLNPDQTVSIDRLGDLAGVTMRLNYNDIGFKYDRGMTMTSSAERLKNVTVKDGIKAADVKYNNNEATFAGDYAVEKVLAKAQVVQKSGFYDDPLEVYGMSSVTLRSWSVQGSANRTYLYTNHSGPKNGMHRDGDGKIGYFEYSASYTPSKYNLINTVVHTDAGADNLITMSDVMSRDAVEAEDGRSFTGLYSSMDDARGEEGYFTNVHGQAVEPRLLENFLPRKVAPADSLHSLTGTDILAKDLGLSFGSPGTSRIGYNKNLFPSISDYFVYFMENSYSGDYTTATIDRAAHAVIYAKAVFSASKMSSSALIGEFLDPAKLGDLIEVRSLFHRSNSTFNWFPYNGWRDISSSELPAGSALLSEDYSNGEEAFLKTIIDPNNNLNGSPYVTDPATKDHHLSWPRIYWVEVSGDKTDLIAGLQTTHPEYFDNGDGKTRVKKYDSNSGTYINVTASDDISSEDYYYLLVIDYPGTFYIGYKDGKIYDTLLSARVAGNTMSRKYQAGQMVYLHPLNAVTDSDGKIYNCDTRRNNIYQLQIAGLLNLGYNYNLVDPLDPIAPKPYDNPDEPPQPVPPINKPLIDIVVEAKLGLWNTQERKITLK